MNLLEEIVLSCFDVAMLNLLGNSLLREKIKFRKLRWIKSLIFAILIGSCGSYISNLIVATIVNIILVFAMFKVMYKKSFFDTILIYIINMVMLSCIQLFVLFLIKLGFGGISNNYICGMVAQIVGLVFVFIAYRHIPLYIIYEYTKENNKTVKYLLLNSFLILFFIGIYWRIDINGLIENLISIMALSMAIVFVNFVILKNGLKNKYEHQELEIYKTYLPRVEQLIDDIRTRQHEFDNHIQALKMMRKIGAENQKDSVEELIDEYYKNIIEKNKWNYLIKLNNKIFSGFLYSKIKQAEKDQIAVEVLLYTYFIDSKMKDYELIELVGVLIDNAFEAVLNEQEKIVVIKITKEQDMNVIEVRNKYPYLEDEVIQNMFKKGFSTKSNSIRGYGLYNLQCLVNKYNGRIEVANEGEQDNYVVIKVYFN